MRAQAPYRASTSWQAEDYHVTVLFGEFSSVAEAGAMGSVGGSNSLSVARLILDSQGLWIVLSDGSRHAVSDDDVEVEKLRLTSRDKLVWDCTDFERVQISISDFWKIPELTQGFGSLSYGVRDAAGTYVPVDGVEIA